MHRGEHYRSVDRMILPMWVLRCIAEFSLRHVLLSLSGRATVPGGSESAASHLPVKVNGNVVLLRIILAQQIVAAKSLSI
ncbi:hypothetical protein GTP38_02855 [Duganella sp. FT94W]|uniref:Secreted protein n=1 Tax=Duganella lactea TaxID=2692173 RepID=A0ABW9V361_9BURK|nr:hypothetical protein [Duganella lactea]MYM33279.1 hypothetical protein [Duganella lactea]